MLNNGTTIGIVIRITLRTSVDNIVCIIYNNAIEETGMV